MVPETFQYGLTLDKAANGRKDKVQVFVEKSSHLIRNTDAVHDPPLGKCAGGCLAQFQGKPCDSTHPTLGFTQLYS